MGSTPLIIFTKTKKIYQDQRAQSNLDKLNNDLIDVKRS